jgi:photosystem II stability/assembly factor-like uncharacterized protein
MLVMSALAASIAGAQSWVPVGAPGGNVRALAQDPRDPQRIYLGTADGILYRSDDGGAQWNRLAPGFPRRGCSLDEIAVDTRGTVFIGYWEIHGRGGGVAKSRDGGKTFTVLQDIDGESVRALALAPSDPEVIAAGTLTGVFLSRNGGQSWMRITPSGHADLRNVESLAFDPTDSQVLYAGTWHLVWKTLNGGGEWAPVHRGMIDDSDVMTLNVDRRHPKTVYATACTGIYKSVDGARQWIKLRGIPYSSRRTRAFAQGADRKLLLAGTTEGLWISENGGGTWRQTTPKELVVNSVLEQPDGTILLGTEEAGVLRSSDRGQSWAASNEGFSERFVFKLLFDDVGGRLVVALWGAPRYGGVLVSQGVGGPWTRLGVGLDDRRVLSLALQGPTILAGTDDGIFAWTPDATAWTRLSTELDGREAHPRVTELLAMPPRRVVAATADGVIHSADAGSTWTRPALEGMGEVFSLAASPEDLDLVVAATRTGFFRSRDGGESWERLSAALDGVTPHEIAFVPSNDRVLFATTSGGLFRSSDQGVHWKRVNGGIPHSDLTGIAISPDGRTVYVSDFTWGGIFRSVDGGSTWNRMPTDGLGSDRVWTLSVDPAAPERLLAGASAGGLHLLVPGSVARNGVKEPD